MYLLDTLPLEWQDISGQEMDGTLFVGGGCSGSLKVDARVDLYSFRPRIDTRWSIIDTPTHWFGLVALKSRLQLVGGRDNTSRETMNKIFTLKDGEFVETLSPMIKGRWRPSLVSTGSVLVVTGGWGD